MRLVAAPHPFKTEIVDAVVPDGLTISEMIEHSQFDPVLAAHSHVWINDHYVPQDKWHLVRPKIGTTLILRAYPQGGGGGGKSPLKTVLLIAVMIAAPYAGAYLAGAAGFTAGTAAFTVSAAIGSAVVSAAGNMLINAIAPVRPPSMAGLSGTGTQRDSPTMFIDGARNAERPFGVIPSVLGVHRNVPPLGVKSYTETIGDEQYLRMLVVWGYGPLKIEDIKIGETAISEFDGVQIETREGRVGDAAITLIPDSVDQDDMSILLTQAAGWQRRSAPVNADELSIDVTFGQGLVKFGKFEGTRQKQSVSMQIQYREIGSGTWLTPTFTAKTVKNAWVSGDKVTFTHRRTSAIRHGFRWDVAARGDYEIRTRRTTSDSTSDKIYDIFSWTAIRSITDEPPISFEHPLAVTALVIKATDQLNRAVDELNATTSSYVNSYQGGSVWAEAVSSNPADLYRHVFQGNANARGLVDARLDIEKLQDWHDFNVANGFEFNMIRDFQSSVWDTAADIAAAGRGSPSQNDGKWSVVFDEEQTVPVQHFTPRNSWGFEAEKKFPDQPHAFRVRFNNREKDWRQDERIVYADGYTSANAEDFDGLDGPGITDPDHIWKFARFSLAQAELRPERWMFNTDFEYIVARRGDLVIITHDVLLVGLASGRIKSVSVDGSSNVTGIVSDEVLTMESGKDYGISIRTVTDAEITAQVVTSVGGQTTITFTTPIPAASAPVAGDLFGFGILGSETIEGLLLSIEPMGELSARLTCIPASPAVYSSDTGSIPAFDSKLTALPGVPVAIIANVRSDESVLQLGAGNTIIPHIAISVDAVNDPAVALDVQIRSTGTDEPFYDANVPGIAGTDYLVNGIEEREYYDLRVRWRDSEGSLRTPGPWTYHYGHAVIGQTEAPAALINPTISAFGGQAFIRWERPSELDVRFGGEVRFRHSPETAPSLAEWVESTSIGEAAKGDSLFATLPLKPGTYLARVFDKGGRQSADFSTMATKQASVLEYADVDTIDEAPLLSGVHNGTYNDGGILELVGAGLIDDIPDFDAIPDLDYYGGVVPSGTYTFALGFDLTTVKRVRLTSRVTAINENVLDLIDDRTELIDDWVDFDGTESAQCDCQVWARHTDDDPAGSPTWTEWQRLDSAEFFARGFQFKAELTSNDPAFNIEVSTLGVDVEEIV